MSWWNTADVSRLNGVFFESVEEVGAEPPDDLPPGPSIFRYFDDEELTGLLGAAGLEVTPPAAVTTIHLLDSPDQLWQGTINSAVRLGAVIRGEPETVRDRIRAALERRVQPYVEPDRVRIPISFKIASGTKPTDSDGP